MAKQAQENIELDQRENELTVLQVVFTACEEFHTVCVLGGGVSGQSYMWWWWVGGCTLIIASALWSRVFSL